MSKRYDCNKRICRFGNFRRRGSESRWWDRKMDNSGTSPETRHAAPGQTDPKEREIPRKVFTGQAVGDGVWNTHGSPLEVDKASSGLPAHFTKEVLFLINFFIYWLFIWKKISIAKGEKSCINSYPIHTYFFCINQFLLLNGLTSSQPYHCGFSPLRMQRPVASLCNIYYCLEFTYALYHQLDTKIWS